MGSNPIPSTNKDLIEVLNLMSKKTITTAIIYDKRGNILSIGRNSYIKTHPLQYKYAVQVNEPNKIYIHAEVSAIVRCKNLDKAYKIVITRFDSKGNPVNSKPCPICTKALEFTNIRIIEHT